MVTMSSLGSGRPSSVSQYHCKCGMPSSGATKQLWALHCLQIYLVQLDLLSPAFVPLPDFSP